MKIKITETLSPFNFKLGVSLPKSTFKLPAVKFILDLPGSVYVAVRKNDILTDLTLSYTFEDTSYFSKGSILDGYVEAVLRDSGMSDLYRIMFEDYFHGDQQERVVLTPEKVSRKLEHGDLNRILLPYAWVFQFVWAVAQDYMINPMSLAGAIIRTARRDKASNTITLKPSGYYTIFLVNYLVTRMNRIIEGMSSIYDSDVIIRGAAFMLIEILNVSPDSGDSAKVNQWLHQD